MANKIYAFRVVTESHYDGETEYGYVPPIKVSASRKKALEAARRLMKETIADDSDLNRLLPDNGALSDYLVDVNNEVIERGEDENWIDEDYARINTRIRPCAGIDYEAIRVEEVELDFLDGNEVVPKELYDQTKWERDLAISQLHELGVELGQEATFATHI